jgi:predicted TIM-barrel fold metal-dependent hydrolase
MNVDVHAHLFPTPYLDYLEGHGLEFGLPGEPFTVVSKLYEVDERLADMAASRVDLQVLSLGPPGVDVGEARQSVDLARAFNDAVAELARARPDRFAAFAAVPLQDPPAAARELERAVRELGLRGGHVFSNVRGRFLDAPEFWPVWEMAEALDVPLFIHPTTPVCTAGTAEWGLMITLAFLLDSSVTASRLVMSGVLERFPGLTFILSHLGSVLPYVLSRFDIAAGGLGHTAVPKSALAKPPSEYFRRFYLDTVSYHRPAYVCALETWGVDRILLGSDYPYLSWRRAVEAVDELGLPAVDAAKIRGENARTLLRL